MKWLSYPARWALLVCGVLAIGVGVLCGWALSAMTGERRG